MNNKICRNNIVLSFVKTMIFIIHCISAQSYTNGKTWFANDFTYSEEINQRLSVIYKIVPIKTQGIIISFYKLVKITTGLYQRFSRL